ncbi:hypothetical protein VitviT2T_024365 [Vitis vinifera]|uniref:Uncharacterized protein n=1 Tax=Vitis vinifera TaxID=29760 RepID=A0ABY9DFD3_VITVI|nr:hypothetical protein VitviT2T_024365 [Vitis vinifera]
MERGAVAAVRRHLEDVAAMAAGASTRMAGAGDDGDELQAGLAAGGDARDLPGDAGSRDLAGDADSRALASGIDAGYGDIGNFRDSAGTLALCMTPALDTHNTDRATGTKTTSQRGGWVINECDSNDWSPMLLETPPKWMPELQMEMRMVE